MKQAPIRWRLLSYMIPTHFVRVSVLNSHGLQPQQLQKVKY